MSYLGQCVFKKTENNDTIISGFPISNITEIVRFKDLIVPNGLYSSNIFELMDPQHIPVKNFSKITTINNDVYDKLLNNITPSNPRKKQIKTRKNKNKKM